MYSLFDVRGKKNLLTGVLWCFITIPVTAQMDSLHRQRIVNLGPVVVTGDGYHQHLRSAITPVSVVTAQDIQKYGVENFTEALTAIIPQLSVSPNSTGSYLLLNGLSNKYVLVLINGIKLIGDISGNIDLNRLDLSQVRRIEVLDGADSSLYGSGAIGGVINIIIHQRADRPFFSVLYKYLRSP